MNPEIEQLLLNDAEKETLEKFIGADAELPDMLNARERRVWMQEQLLSEFPGVLVSFTLNIPGPVKVLPLVPEAFAFALSEIVSALDTAKIPVLKRSLILDKTGPEAFLCVDADALAVKRLLVPLEDASDLGRLYDIDIIGREEKRSQEVTSGSRAGPVSSAAALRGNVPEAGPTRSQS